MSLRGKKVLVTGASGFIGGRLVEKLILQHGAEVRALVRDYRRAIRNRRFDVELICADITNADEVIDAVTGCDVVFHCAFGASGSPREKRAATVDGTKNVCEAARLVGVSRLVHLSTLSVYGDVTSGVLDESSERQYTGQLYADMKIDAEKIVENAHHENHLPTVILQPTAVYGPFGGWWTRGQIDLLKNNRVALPGNGEGICNSVYLDDVVDACIKVAEHPDAVGETFLVSGPEAVSWNEYYAKLETMLDRPSVVHLSAREIRQRQNKQKEPRTLLGWAYQALLGRPDLIQRIVDSWIGLPYRLAMKVVPEKWNQGDRGKVPDTDGSGLPKGEGNLEHGSTRKPVDHRPLLVPDPASLRQYTSTTRVSTEKLRRIVSYEPQYSLDRGMALTGQWAKWAGLLD